MFSHQTFLSREELVYPLTSIINLNVWWPRPTNYILFRNVWWTSGERLVMSGEGKTRLAQVESKHYMQESYTCAAFLSVESKHYMQESCTSWAQG
jgi:hypothetical protein